MLGAELRPSAGRTLAHLAKSSRGNAGTASRTPRLPGPVAPDSGLGALVGIVTKLSIMACKSVLLELTLGPKHALIVHDRLQRELSAVHVLGPHAGTEGGWAGPRPLAQGAGSILAPQGVFLAWPHGSRPSAGRPAGGPCVARAGAAGTCDRSRLSPSSGSPAGTCGALAASPGCPGVAPALPWRPQSTGLPSRAQTPLAVPQAGRTGGRRWPDKSAPVRPGQEGQEHSSVPAPPPPPRVQLSPEWAPWAGTPRQPLGGAESRPLLPGSDLSW